MSILKDNMDTLKSRKLIDDASDIDSLTIESSKLIFDEIYKILESNKNFVLDDKTVILRRELFQSLTHALFWLKQKTGSIPEDRKETFNNIFSILSEEKSTELWGDSTYPLDLLRYLINGLNRLGYGHYTFENSDTSYQVISRKMAEGILVIDRKNLLEYLRSQRNDHTDDIYCRTEIAEFMYQLDLTEKEEIFEVVKEYILDLDSFGSWGGKTCDLLRDDEIKSYAIDFLIENIESNTKKVEQFLLAHLVALDDPESWPYKRKIKSEGYTYFRPDDLEPLTSHYKSFIEENSYDIDEVFKPSSRVQAIPVQYDLSKENKKDTSSILTNFEVAIDICFMQLRMKNFATEFNDYDHMEHEIRDFLSRYFDSQKKKLEFQIYVRKKNEIKSITIKDYNFDEDRDLKQMMSFINAKAIYPDEIGDLDKLFYEMINFFAYEFISEERQCLTRILNKRI